jgi:serine/threonine-protein kinase SRPK3
LFTNNEGGRRKSAPAHMARMVSLLGPPPQDMLDIPPASKRFFDKEGKNSDFGCLGATELRR